MWDPVLFWDLTSGTYLEFILWHNIAGNKDITEQVRAMGSRGPTWMKQNTAACGWSRGNFPFLLQSPQSPSFGVGGPPNPSEQMF